MGKPWRESGHASSVLMGNWEQVPFHMIALCGNQATYCWASPVLEWEGMIMVCIVEHWVTGILDEA